MPKEGHRTCTNRMAWVTVKEKISLDVDISGSRFELKDKELALHTASKKATKHNNNS